MTVIHSVLGIVTLLSHPLLHWKAAACHVPQRRMSTSLTQCLWSFRDPAQFVAVVVYDLDLAFFCLTAGSLGNLMTGDMVTMHRNTLAALVTTERSVLGVASVRVSVSVDVSLSQCGRVSVCLLTCLCLGVDRPVSVFGRVSVSVVVSLSLCVDMFLWMCLCLSVDMSVSVCGCISVCLLMCLWAYLCLSVNVSLSLCGRVCICRRVSVDVFLCGHVCVCLWTCRVSVSVWTCLSVDVSLSLWTCLCVDMSVSVCGRGVSLSRCGHVCVCGRVSVWTCVCLWTCLCCCGCVSVCTRLCLWTCLCRSQLSGCLALLLFLLRHKKKLFVRP